MRLRFRRGIQGDANAITELYLRARMAAIPAIPMMVHTDEETRLWVSSRVVPHAEVWVAETDDESVVGMLVLRDDWVDQLYVEPALTGQGIGSQLISVAKRQRPLGLRLWTFESNLHAQRFYERHGFEARDRTAGENEEGAPDILYVWDGGPTAPRSPFRSPSLAASRSWKRSSTRWMVSGLVQAKPVHPWRSGLSRSLNSADR